MGKPGDDRSAGDARRAGPGGRQRDRNLWSGRVKLGSFWALHRGAIGDNRPHSHHAMQLSAAPDELSARFDGSLIAAKGVFIASMRRHALAPAGDAASLYVDAASPIGRVLADAFASRSDRLAESEAAALCRLDPDRADDGAILSFLRALSAPPAGNEPALDARLSRALALLEEELDQALPLRRLSTDVRLSEGRLSRLFQRDIGMPYRPYRRWRRVQHALLLVQEGASLTEAAIDAGFSDSAHFSRTIRRVFGVRASAIAPLLRTAAADSFKR